MSWTEKENRLQRDIRTPDFITAYNLVSRIVAPAEALNHHPDITFGWGYVHIALTTHDAGGVTDKDRALAQRIDEAIRPFGG
jgi:4a-hydroxytetrahydrobiopterin dehydratase